MTAALSPREREIVVLLAEGLTQKRIAARLRISQRTVETHLATARAKYGVANCTQLVHVVETTD